MRRSYASSLPSVASRRLAAVLFLHGGGRRWCATPAAGSSAPLPPQLERHLAKWGSRIAAVNLAEACGSTDAVTHAAAEGPIAASAACVDTARKQLAALCRLWSADAEVLLCGSSVTLGHVTATSDLDFVCAPQGRETPNGSVTPDRHKQLAAVDALHRHLSKYLPTYMRRGFVALRTARTPVVKFTFTHEPPTRVRVTQQLDAAASELKPAPLQNAAAASEHSEAMLAVAPAVRRSKFAAPASEAEEALSRTVLLHFRGMRVEQAALVKALADLGIAGVKVTAIADDAADVLVHPGGYDAPTSAAEDHSLRLQAEAAAASKSFTSTLATVRAASGLDALRVIAAFPDGGLVPRGKRDAVTADFADRRCIPALLRYQWDVSFAGFSAANSVLLRHYLLKGAPAWAPHGALALKRWARATHVANASLGYLTPYAVSLMWAYYLLVAGRVQWLDPAAVAVPAQLPPAPPRGDLAWLMQPLSDRDAAALGRHLAAFFQFYSDLRVPSAALAAVDAAKAVGAAPRGFRSDVEVASVSRPRRSTRDDVGWSGPGAGGRGAPATGATSSKAVDPPGFLFCVEDPYELVGEGGLNLGRHLTQSKLEFINTKSTRALRCLLLREPPAAPAADAPAVARDDDADDCGLLGIRRDPEPDAEE